MLWWWSNSDCDSDDSDELLMNVGLGKVGSKRPPTAAKMKQRSAPKKRAKVKAPSPPLPQGPVKAKLRAKKSKTGQAGGKAVIGTGARNAVARMLIGGAADEMLDEVMKEAEEAEEEAEEVPDVTLPQGDEEVMLEHDPYLTEMKASLLTVIDTLELPPNPLDYLIDLLGGPHMVAELTGRPSQLLRWVTLYPHALLDAARALEPAVGLGLRLGLRLGLGLGLGLRVPTRL